MPLYEHIFLVRQDASQQQVDALAAQFKSVVENNGGKVGKTENWGLRTITFRIRKNRKAHYTLINIERPQRRSLKWSARCRSMRTSSAS